MHVKSGKWLEGKMWKKGEVEKEAREVSEGGDLKSFMRPCEGGQTVWKVRRGH